MRLLNAKMSVVRFTLRGAFLFLFSYAQTVFAESRVYSTYEEMVKNKSLSEGDFVTILGFYKVNDGGLSEYYISSKANAIDSTDLIVKINSKLNAVLIHKGFVNYKMFGAKGDSLSDDAPAIAATHLYANRKDIPVINRSGKFWMKTFQTVSIQTDVDWGTSVFYIDERGNSARSARFNVMSRNRPLPVKLSKTAKEELLKKLKPGVLVIDELAHFKNHLISIADANDRIGFRSGERFNGQSWAREELFLVEEQGRILGDIAWQFSNYTELIATPVDQNYLVIEGGLFYLSGENPSTNDRKYFKCGFSITRCKTIIRNQWVGLMPGAKDTSTLNPRSGFYSFSRTYDVQLENVRLIPFEQDRGDNSKNVSSGTYGITMNRVLKSLFKNVVAEGNKAHWGVFGSNINKDFVVENCKLNRVDVHFHCWNLRISNSQIGLKGITVTGGGKLVIDNSSCAGRNFINFRKDFGAKWDGDIIITNSVFNISSADKTLYAFNFSPSDVSYGYPIGPARNILINNFTVDFRGVDRTAAVCWLFKFPVFSRSKTGEPVFLPGNVRIENVMVRGREKGLRLFTLPSPGEYALSKKGSYVNGNLHSNATFIFDNIDFEDIADETERGFHFSVTGKAGYKEGNGLYADISFLNCKNLSIKNDQLIANISLFNSGLQRFSNASGGPGKGRLSLMNCTLQPVLSDSTDLAYHLEAEGTTNFVNCLLQAPVLKGKLRPDLVNQIGIMELNRKVRYHHVNTRLGADLLKYYSTGPHKLTDQFIRQLKMN